MRDHDCETLIEPKIIPPLHCDQVTEPVMRHFMGYDMSQLPVSRLVSLFPEQISAIIIGYQTCIFHGTLMEGSFVFWNK